MSDSKGKRGIIRAPTRCGAGASPKGPRRSCARLTPRSPSTRRLWRQDIAASKAHVAMLGACGIVSAEDAVAIERGLDQVAAEYERDGRARGLGPRRHPHDHRKPACGADRRRGRAAAHRAQPQRPGCDRFPAVGARRDRPGRRGAGGAAAGAGRARRRSMPTASCPASPTCRPRSRSRSAII